MLCALCRKTTTAEDAENEEILGLNDDLGPLIFDLGLN